MRKTTGAGSVTMGSSTWSARIERAAERLLSRYRAECGERVPVDLERLATTLRARVFLVPALEGRGRLIAVKNGFHLLVNESTPRSQRRTIIAHELAHTLFYTSDVTPRRLPGSFAREEEFCYDVARRLLAPPWLVDRVVESARDKGSDDFFGLIVRSLDLSRPVAAAVTLQDYHLACGYAGTWRRTPNGWALERRSARASTCLVSPVDRRLLRNAVLHWLETRTQANSMILVRGRFSPPQKRDEEEVAFAMATIRVNCSAANHEDWRCAFAPDLLRSRQSSTRHSDA